MADSKLNPLQQAHSDEHVELTCVSFAELSIKEDIYYAIRAGKGEGTAPSVATIHKHIEDLKTHAVALADARRRLAEFTNADSVRNMLREAINLAAVGDIDESTEAMGWGDWMRRAKAAVGDPLAEVEAAIANGRADKVMSAALNVLTAPPATFKGAEVVFDDPAQDATRRFARPIGMHPGLGADFGPSVGGWPQMAGRLERPEPSPDNLTTQQEMTVAEIGAVINRQPEVLSGCAVRAAIQNEEPPNDERLADLEHARREAMGEPEHKPDAEGNCYECSGWDFYGLPRTRTVSDVPIYFWAGREGRPSSNRYRKNAEGMPTGCEHVTVDETRGDPAGPAPVCRIVESVEPLSLGHALCISREELQPLAADSWLPTPVAGGATTSNT